MINKKGFTLAELIGVIVVLGIIALIAVPVVSDRIEESRVESAKRSAEGIVESAMQYYTDEMSANGTFDTPNIYNGKSVKILDVISDAKLLDIEGEMPDSGFVSIDSDCNIDVFLIKGKYCIHATSKDEKTTSSKDLSNCAR